MLTSIKHKPSLFGIISGILVSWIFSHPSSPAKKKLPQRSVKNIHYHIHHWIYFGIIYYILFAFQGKFKGKKSVEGFILGLVIHGLSYKDRFVIKKQAGSGLFGFFRCGGGDGGFFENINFLLNKSNRIFNIV